MRPFERLVRQKKYDEQARNRAVLRYRRAVVATLNPLTVTLGGGDVPATALEAACPLVVADAVDVVEIGGGYPPVVLGRTTTDAS